MRFASFNIGKVTRKCVHEITKVGHVTWDDVFALAGELSNVV